MKRLKFLPLLTVSVTVKPLSIATSNSLLSTAAVGGQSAPDPKPFSEIPGQFIPSLVDSQLLPLFPGDSQSLYISHVQP